MSANQSPHAGVAWTFRRYRIGCKIVGWWLHQLVQVMISEPWRRRRSWSLNRRLNGTTLRRHSAWDDVYELNRHFAGCEANVITSNWARFNIAALNLQLVSQVLHLAVVHTEWFNHIWASGCVRNDFQNGNFPQNVKGIGLLLNKPYTVNLCQ